MNKHAYLILCHDEFEVLKRLCLLLDDTRNDIYILVDKKAKIFSEKSFDNLLENASLTFVNRIKVAWGGYSQIAAELILLSEAIKTKHSYYHFLSGVDLPIKTQNQIHEFFAMNDGKEFIGIDSSTLEGFDAFSRCGLFHFFQDYFGRIPGYKSLFWEKMEQLSLVVQRKLGVNRLSNKEIIYKGPNWFSITHDLACYVLEAKDEIKRKFKYGLCVDELFLQTVAMNSPYRKNIVKSCLRYIDWDRGTPYTWTHEDYDSLMASSAMFARKFSYINEREVVDKIYEKLRTY